MLFFLHSKNVRRTLSVSAVLRAPASCAKLESLNQKACWLLPSGESKLAKSSKHPFQMFTTRRNRNGQTESNLPYLMTRGYPGGKNDCHGCSILPQLYDRVFHLWKARYSSRSFMLWFLKILLSTPPIHKTWTVLFHERNILCIHVNMHLLSTWSHS